MLKKKGMVTNFTVNTSSSWMMFPPTMCVVKLLFAMSIDEPLKSGLLVSRRRSYSVISCMIPENRKIIEDKIKRAIASRYPSKYMYILEKHKQIEKKFIFILGKYYTCFLCLDSLISPQCDTHSCWSRSSTQQNCAPLHSTFQIEVNLFKISTDCCKRNICLHATRKAETKCMHTLWTIPVRLNRVVGPWDSISSAAMIGANKSLTLIGTKAFGTFCKIYLNCCVLSIYGINSWAFAMQSGLHLKINFTLCLGTGDYLIPVFLKVGNDDSCRLVTSFVKHFDAACHADGCDHLDVFKGQNTL